MQIMLLNTWSNFTIRWSKYCKNISGALNPEAGTIFAIVNDLTGDVTKFVKSRKS